MAFKVGRNMSGEMILKKAFAGLLVMTVFALL